MYISIQTSLTSSKIKRYVHMIDKIAANICIASRACKKLDKVPLRKIRKLYNTRDSTPGSRSFNPNFSSLFSQLMPSPG